MVVDAIQSFVYCNCMCYICRLKTDIITHSIHLSQTYCMGTWVMFRCVYFSLHCINYVFCLVRISEGNFGKHVAIFMHGCILKWQKY